jgi:DNA invertase Pin-like site-specific DNA recombinase
VIKGYARVSTDGQDLATQHELLKAVGAEVVYSEKQSGVKSDRAALARGMASLEPADTVVVTKLDRLARSTRTCSTLSQQSALLERASSRWVILGPTPQHRTAG